jgi:4-amino-4-deoxy-L-arabinose transferase-like glycosyltransferase
MMQLTSSQHKAIAIFLFLALTIFLRLGSGEIQPWDEGLNAIRARAVLQHHTFSIHNEVLRENINSADYAPITIYVITGIMKIFGKTPFAIRFFTALCSALALFFFYLISRRMLSYNGSIIALFLISGSMAWNTFARQGTSEVPTVAFLLCALYFIIKVMESINRKNLLLNSLGFAIAFIAALLTKHFVILLPIIFLALFYFEKEKRRQALYLTLASVAALVFALLFYILMESKSGISFFYNFLPTAFHSPDSENAHLSGIFYYFGQLILSNPFCLFTFVYIVFYIVKRKVLLSRNTEHVNYLNNVLIIWFVLTFILLAGIYPNAPQTTVYILPPALLLAMKFFDDIHLLVENNRIIWLIFSVLITLFFWSYIFILREDVMILFLGGKISVTALIYVSLIALLVLAGLFVPKKNLSNISTDALSKAVVVIPYLLILKIIFMNLTIPTGTSFGAANTAIFLKAIPQNEFIYLYHGNNKLDPLNPQLDWYTDGWLSGWLPGKTYIPVGLKGNDTDLSILRELDNYPGLFIVYYLPSNKTISDGVIKDISQTRSIIKRHFNYIIFGRKNSERSIDSTV